MSTCPETASAGALDLAGLEDRVAVRENHDAAALAERADEVERARVEALGEGVVEEEARDGENLRRADRSCHLCPAGLPPQRSIRVSSRRPL